MDPKLLNVVYVSLDWIHMAYLSLYFTDTAKHAHVMLQGLSFWEDFLPAFPVYRYLPFS